MVPITRRRRFILLVGVCCVSLIAFGWWGKGERSFMDLSNLIVDSEGFSSDETVEQNTVPLISGAPPPEVHVGPMAVTAIVGDDDEEEDEYYGDEAVVKQNVEYDLNSEPTEFAVGVTQPMDLVSGPPVSTESYKVSNAAVESATTSGLSQATPRPVRSSGLIVDTEACKIPMLDPWDPTVIGLFEAKEKLKCDGPPLFMRPQPNGAISLNETVLKEFYQLKPEDLSCEYASINRKHEEPGNVRENDYVIGEPSPLQFGVPLEEDYTRVDCVMGSKEKKFQQFFPLVRLRKELEEERDAIRAPGPKLNVILAGIDSISKLNFLRHFNRTRAFLEEKLQPFEMRGYTKVGDNTFPNLVPLLTGHFVEHYWNESMRDEMYFDSLDLIWKDYAKRGYRTFYAEDSPFTGTFNYIKKGFYDPPTDYYFRPLALALEGSDIRKHSSYHCLNGQVETDIIYDYLRDFVKTMDHRPHIGFAMVSTMTHDYLNKAGLADDPAVRLLEDLHVTGALNTSMLVFFSDHGLRFGAIRQTYIGKFEERMPFMYVHLPSWFLKQHPDIRKNLERNQERLITLFDIHATMVDLLHLGTSQVSPVGDDTRGTSLFGEISTNRTCEEANILPHWCPCQSMVPLPLTDPRTLHSARAIVDHINAQLATYPACSRLDVDVVSDARLGTANDLVMRFVRNENDVIGRKVVYGDRVDPLENYSIIMTTKPGGAVFEGSVQRDAGTDAYAVLGVSRISFYGNTSHCIDSQKLKIFCYCTVQLT